jgi:ADP-ribose pyrophosphatase
MEKPLWKVRSSTRVVDSPYLHIRRDEVELPDGTVLGDYFVRESSGFTIVFAVTADREAVLIQEYRYGIDGMLLECPAGSLNPGEDPLTCAKRELREETGYEAPRWEKLFALPSEPARSNAIMHAYLALDAVATASQQLDRSEHIEPILHPLADLERLMRTTRERSATSVGSTTTLYAAIERLRALEMM